MSLYAIQSVYKWKNTIQAFRYEFRKPAETDFLRTSDTEVKGKNFTGCVSWKLPFFSEEFITAQKWNLVELFAYF